MCLCLDLIVLLLKAARERYFVDRCGHQIVTAAMRHLCSERDQLRASSSSLALELQQAVTV